MILLVGCSDTTDESEDENNNNDNQENEELNEVDEFDEGELEELATFEIPEEDMFTVRNLKSSVAGDQMVFTAKQKHKRENYYDRTVITDEGDILSSVENSDTKEDDVSCHRGEFSPDGQYYAFECTGDNSIFYLYDLEEGEVTYRAGRSDGDIDYAKATMMDLVAVTDDQEVIFSEDMDNQLIIFDIDSESVEEIDLPANEDTHKIRNVTLTSDNQTIFINTQKDLLEYDRDSGEIEKIVSDSSDETTLNHFNASANGEYASYYRHDSTDLEYYVFVNLTSGEERAFEQDDTMAFSTPDNNGNVVFYHDSISSEAPLQLYNIDEDTAKKIPMIEEEVGIGKEFNLSADGNHLFFPYSEKDREASETVFTFYRYTFGDVNQYEDADFYGVSMDENDTAETDGDSGESFSLYEYSEDPHKRYVELWENSVDIEFPTELPIDPEEKEYSFYSNQYRMEMKEDRASIEFRTVHTDAENSKQCAESDLEKDEKRDGIQYYYYEFEIENELSFAKEGNCYTIIVEELDKEASFGLAESIEPVEEPPFEFDVSEFKFPEELPTEDVLIGSPHIRYNPDSESIRIFHSFEATDDKGFNVTYKASYEDDVKTSRSSHEEIDSSSSDWDTMTYAEGLYELGMYDGEYYYLLAAEKLDDDFKEEHGDEKVKQTLMDIAETMSK